MHVAVYTRETKARGREDNVDVQARLGTAYSQARWPDLPVEVYCDNDITAADDDIFRPDYARLLHNIQAGHVAQVVSADQERITRLIAGTVQPGWEQLSAILRTAGIHEVHGYRDGITSVRLGQTAGGRYKAVAAAEYVEGIKIKVLENRDKLAAAGRPSGGPRPYGYRAGLDPTGGKTLLVVDTESAVVRSIAERVLGGWSLSAIAADLNAQGTPTSGGAGWDETIVRRAVTKPTVAGLRVHRGEIVGPAVWDAILDEVTWRRVGAVLDARNVDADGVVRRRRAARRYLLSGGLAVCGLPGCGGRLVGDRRLSGRNLASMYACRACRGLFVGAAHLEGHVVAKLLGHLGSEAFAARVAAGDVHAGLRRDLAARIGALDADRRAFTAQRGRREIDDDEWEDLRAGNAQARARLNAELAAVPAPPVGLDPAGIVEDWPAMTLDEQRHTLRLFLSRVVVSASRRSGPRFNPERVAVFDRDGKLV